MSSGVSAVRSTAALADVNRRMVVIASGGAALRLACDDVACVLWAERCIKNAVVPAARTARTTATVITTPRRRIEIVPAVAYPAPDPGSAASASRLPPYLLV